MSGMVLFSGSYHRPALRVLRSSISNVASVGFQSESKVLSKVLSFIMMKGIGDQIKDPASEKARKRRKVEDNVIVRQLQQWFLVNTCQESMRALRELPCKLIQ